MKKLVIAILLAGLLAGCGKGTSATEDHYKNSDSGSKEVFTVGFDQNFPPMGFIGEDGEFTGFDIDLAKEAATRMNRELILQPIAWDAKDMELKSGNVDCIWNGFTMNHREDLYTWTKPYLSNYQVIVVKKEAAIQTLADLSGKTVAVQKESSAEAALADKPDLVASFAQLLPVADYNTGFLDLEAGAVDAIAIDEIVARYQIEKRKADFTILEDKIAQEQYGVGFLLGNDELKNQVEQILIEMAADQTLAQISEKWFGQDITTIQ